MKKILLLFLILVTAAACQESLEDRTAREVSEYTRKNCPTPIVDYQQTDSIIFERDTRTIHYYMKFCGAMDNGRIVDTNRKKITEAIAKNVETDTRKKTYREAGFKFRYTFRSQREPKKTLLDFTTNGKRES